MAFSKGKTIERKNKMKKLFTVTLCVLLTLSFLSITALAGGRYIEDPNTTNTFEATDDNGNIGYNFKDGGGAWANIMNPWGKSAFMVFDPGEGFVQSMIVTFKIEGYDGGAEGYRVMCGFGINGWSPSVWSLDADGDDNSNWEEIYGEKFYYYIVGDGYYQFIIDFRGAMDWFESENDWYIKDYLEGIDCIELGIFSPPDDTTMKLTIISVEETGDIYSFESVSRNIGTDKFFAQDLKSFLPLPNPEPPREPRYDENGEDEAAPPIVTGPGPAEPPDDTPTVPQETLPTPDATPPAASGDSDSAGMQWWVWLLIGGGAIGAVVIVVAVVKTKK